MAGGSPILDTKYGAASHGSKPLADDPSRNQHFLGLFRGSNMTPEWFMGRFLLSLPHQWDIYIYTYIGYMGMGQLSCEHESYQLLSLEGHTMTSAMLDPDLFWTFWMWGDAQHITTPWHCGLW